MPATTETLSAQKAEFEQHSDHAFNQLFALDGTFVFLCRAISGIGGGFAFGWSVLGSPGALLGLVLGLLAFLLAQKHGR